MTHTLNLEKKELFKEKALPYGNSHLPHSLATASPSGNKAIVPITNKNWQLEESERYQIQKA